MDCYTEIKIRFILKPDLMRSWLWGLTNYAVKVMVLFALLSSH